MKRGRIWGVCTSGNTRQSFLAPLYFLLLRPYQECLFGRARPPGGPSPRDSEQSFRKLSLHTGRPAVGPLFLGSVVEWGRSSDECRKECPVPKAFGTGRER